MPGVTATFDAGHIKRHYYERHRTLNPSGVVPVGPAIDFDGPHDRARLAPGR